MLGTIGEMVGTGRPHPVEACRRGFGEIWGFCDGWEVLWRVCDDVTVFLGALVPRDWCGMKQWLLPKLGGTGVNLGSTGGWLAKPTYQTRIWQSWFLNVKLCLVEAGDRWAPGEALRTGLLFTFLGLRKKWASSQTLKTSLLFAFPETWDTRASG